MSIKVQCSQCNADYSVKDELAGKKLRCKQCSAIMEVPAGDDEWDLGDDEGETIPPPKAKKSSSKSSRSKRSRSSSSGMPVPIIVAIICVILMIGFTLLNMAGTAFGDQMQGMPQGPGAGAQKAGAVMGDVVRLLIQIVVLVGIIKGSSGTRIPAMVLAVLFCLVIGCAGAFAAANHPQGLFIAIALGFSVVLRIVFIACLAVSEDHFSE